MPTTQNQKVEPSSDAGVCEDLVARWTGVIVCFASWGVPREHSLYLRRKVNYDLAKIMRGEHNTYEQRMACGLISSTTERREYNRPSASMSMLILSFYLADQCLNSQRMRRVIT